MDIKQYKKDFEYSYSLGAFPTIELLKTHKKEVVEVLVHSTFDNEDIITKINDLIKPLQIIRNDKLISKLSDKENIFVIGIFKKYYKELNPNKDHLLLDNPSNMGNLGTIIRSALGFNIENLAIIRPGLDIFNPKVIRASMGSIFSMNIEFFDSIDDYKNKYNTHNIYAFMLQASKSLRECSFSNKPITLAFGNEATGLDQRYLNENSIIIKHNDKIDSLNITNAVSIGLYEYNEKKED